MKNLWLFFCLVFFGNLLFAQNSLSVIVKNANTNSPLIGANVYFDSLHIGGSTDNSGFVKISNIPDGKFVISVTHFGYKKRAISVTITKKKKENKLKILLTPESVTTKNIIVTSTRINEVVEDSPVKVEILGQKEVNEGIAKRPEDISKVLAKISGAVIQPLSPIFGTLSFRLQGLPGQYSQLLKDGMPIFSDFSSGLTLLQIAPLDLERVEVVKGPSSFFYGNGAVAGFVNLITKKPVKNGGLELVLNRTTKNGTNISSYYSNKFNNLGVTFLTSFSNQSAVDVAHNSYTDIPEFSQFTINPKLFWNIDESSNLEVGLNVFYENRLGGNMFAVANGSDTLHPFLEKSKSNRYGATVKYNKRFGNNLELNFKSNYSYYKRNWFLSQNKYLFNGYYNGESKDAFSELSLLSKLHNHTIVGGVNYSLNYFKVTDSFIKNSIIHEYDYDYSIGGIFLHDNWNITNKIIIQPALRVDFMKDYSPIYLPHLSLMYKFTDNFSGRISFGRGYKMPTIFELNLNSEIIVWHYVRKTEIPQFRIVRETANGANIDFSYKLQINDIIMKINQSFYYTDVQNGLMIGLRPDVDFGPVIFYNGTAFLSKGFDTNLCFTFDEFELFADYSYMDVSKTIYDKTSSLSLTPKNKLNLTFTYEKERSWRTGVEAFYTDNRVSPNNNLLPQSYWIYGVMFEKFFSNSSVVINIENVLDNRQSKYAKIVQGSNEYPYILQSYMPTEGIIGNLALRIKIK